MMSAQRVAIVLSIACAATASIHVAAQSGGPSPKQETFHTLTLQDGIAPMGKLGAFYGRTDGTGHRIVTKDLSVVQPVTVLAIAADTTEPVRVDLVKGGWDEPMRSGTTDENGRLVLKTRTEGNLGVLVRSTSGKPASYVLAVWAGDEMPSEPASIFATDRAARQSSASNSPVGGSERALWPGTSLWLAGGGLLVLAVIGVFVVHRRAQAHRRSSHEAV